MPVTVPLALDFGDGKRHAVKFGCTAHSRFEERLGFKMFGEVLGHGVTTSFTQTLLWSGLLWKDAALTFEEVGDMMDAWLAANPDKKLRDLATVVLDAYMDSRGVKRKPKPNGHDAEAHSPNAQAETGGSASSPSGGIT